MVVVFVVQSHTKFRGHQKLLRIVTVKIVKNYLEQGIYQELCTQAISLNLDVNSVSTN